MHRIRFLLFLVILLTACTPNATPVPLPTVTSSPVMSVIPTITATPDAVVGDATPTASESADSGIPDVGESGDVQIPFVVSEEILSTLGVTTIADVEVKKFSEKYTRLVANGYGVDYTLNGKGEWESGLTFRPIEEVSRTESVVSLYGVSVNFSSVVDKSAGEAEIPMQEIIYTPGGQLTIVRGIMEILAANNGIDLKTALEKVKAGEGPLQLGVIVEDTTTPNATYQGNEVLFAPGVSEVGKTIAIGDGSNEQNARLNFEVVAVDGESFQGDFVFDNHTNAFLNGDPNEGQHYMGGILRYNESTNTFTLIFGSAQRLQKSWKHPDMLSSSLNSVAELVKSGIIKSSITMEARDWNGPLISSGGIQTVK